MDLVFLETPVIAPKQETVRQFIDDHKRLLLVSAGLIALLYAPNFAKLFADWGKDENYSHGYLVPVAFLFMLWRERKALLNTPVVARTWGLLIVVLGGVQLAVGRMAAENFVAHTSLLTVLAGTTIYLFGIGVLRKVVFPLAWLVFMIPIPAIVYYAATVPLQLLASRIASFMLDLMAVPNVRDGNVISLAHFQFGVAEACSGIRSIISLLALACLLAYLRPMKNIARVVLLLMTLPIALGVNALRIVGSGLAGNYLGPRWAEGFFHTFSGWVLFVGAVFLVMGTTEVLAHLGGEPSNEP